jgi:hypothetical protein
VRKLGKADFDNTGVIQEIEEEWNEFVEANAFRDDEGDLIWGDALIRKLGEKGLATLLYLASRGHFESARIFKETFLGLPEQPLAIRVSEKTANETEVIIREVLIREMKMTPEVAEAMLERFKRSALEGGGDVIEQPVISALPEPKKRKKAR